MRKSEKGQALISVVAGVSLVLLSLIVALIVTQFSGKAIHRQLTYQGQALNAAQAGLTEGLSWFRRQTTQPVTNFYPVRDLSVVPEVNDTEDANCVPALNNLACVGLVRNYEVSVPGRVWARYELRRTRRAPPLPVPSDLAACDPVTETAGTPCYLTQTLDVTSNRGKVGNGVVWQVESEGTIYVRNSTGVAYNVLPNRVLARRKLRAEIQRLGITAPSNAALVTSRSDAVNLGNTDVKIDGNGAFGIAWVNSPAGLTPNGTGYTTGGGPPNPQIPGTPAVISSGIPPVPDRFTIPYIFGLTQQELRGMANIDVGCAPPPVNPVLPVEPCYAQINYPAPPNPLVLPNMSLIVLNEPGNPNQTFLFDSSRPLMGTGILVVLGNLSIAANSNSVYNGVVFVQGRYTQRAPSTVNGTVIVDPPAPVAGVRPVSIQGAGEDAVIRYDRNLINFVARRMGLYDISRSAYLPCRPREICDE